jgi:hypothetical protein
MAQSSTHEFVKSVDDSEFDGARDRLPRWNFEAFHRMDLPRLSNRHGRLIVDDLAGVEPLGFCTPSGAGFSYRPSEAGIDLLEGTEHAATIVELRESDFSDFVNEVHTASGLAHGHKLHFIRGDLAALQRWEPALRALYQGRPIWTSAEARHLVDAEGNPLDLSRTFELSDSDALMRAFLETAGFLHVRAAFSSEEVAALGAEVDRVRDALEPGTGDCWWSLTEGGDQVVTRINYLDRWSEAIKAACWDERVQRLGRLLGSQFRVCDDRLDGPMAFIKNSGVASGLGNLEWHQDDGLGGHPVMCPLMQVGIQLDAANAENGQVWLLAGSHRHSKHPLAWGEEGDNPVVQLVTEPGDVTVHNGDIYHTTPPPTGHRAGRRVLYYKFAEEKTFQAIPAGAHYNDLLFKAGSGGRVATRADTWSDDDNQANFQHASFTDRDTD